jgi:hypothetical protein
MRAHLTYWGGAFLVALAVQWPSFWAFFAALVIQVMWDARRKKQELAKAQRLPVAAEARSIPLEKTLAAARREDAPKPTQAQEEEIPLAEGQVYDPMVVVPDAYRSTINWDLYEIPTCMRKQPEPEMPEQQFAPFFEDIPSPPAPRAEVDEPVGADFVHV